MTNDIMRHIHVLAKTNPGRLHINNCNNKPFPDDNIQGSDSNKNSSLVIDSNLNPDKDGGPIILDNHPNAQIARVNDPEKEQEQEQTTSNN